MNQIRKIPIRLLISTLLVLIGGELIAQKTYVTRKGFMVIKAIVGAGDSLKTYNFNNLDIQLDYQKAIVDISFGLDKSLADNVYLNQFSSEKDAKITAQLSIPKIETQPHPNWDFHTTGELTFDNKAYFLVGNGELRHHDGSETMACYLMLKLRPMEGRDLDLKPLGKIQELHLFQTVLSQQVIDGEGR